MSMLSRLNPRTLERFMDRLVARGYPRTMLIENPTEELIEAAQRGRQITIHGASPAENAAREALKSMERKTGDIRYEENYFYSSRRYPKSVGNDIAAVAGSHIPAGRQLYFNQPIGGDGVLMGFATGFEISGTETNLDAQNQLPQGKGYKILEEGISFNSEAFIDDIEQVLDSGHFEFTTQGKQFSIVKGPLRLWPGGTGVSGVTTVQGTETGHNGIADPRAVRKLKFPRVLKPLQNFNYIHDVPRGVRATTATEWKLDQFTIATVWLWGHQLDAIPG